MIPNVNRGVSAVRARNSTLPTRRPWPGATTMARASMPAMLWRGRRPGASGRRGGAGQRPELGHQPELVDGVPVLGDAPVDAPHDVDPGDLHVASGRRDAGKRAAVHAVEDLARHDAVALGDLVEDLGAKALERGAEAVELLAHALGTLGDPRRAAVVDQVGADERVERPLVAGGLVLL